MMDSDNIDFLGFSPNNSQSKGDRVVSGDEIEQANSMARQLHVYKPGISFVPGAALEVLDSRDNNWYHCKVVEVDWGELDILVHYQRWSIRFDEWLKMDSTRLRPYVARNSRSHKKGFYKIGDKVLARWAPDGRNYEAKITRVVDDEYCEVLYYDGVTRVLRVGHLNKFDAKFNSGASTSGYLSPQRRRTIESSELHRYSEDANKSSIFEVKILEEKRKPKRKAEVEELIQSMKKKRKISEEQAKKSSSSPKSPALIKESKSSVHKKRFSDSAVDDAVRSDTSSPIPSTSKVNMIEFPCLHGKDWIKLCTKRPGNKNKWDISYVAPNGKRMRSKHDLQRYFDHTGVDLNVDLFDFSTKCVKDYFADLKQEEECEIYDEEDFDNDDNNIYAMIRQEHNQKSNINDDTKKDIEVVNLSSSSLDESFIKEENEDEIDDKKTPVKFGDVKTEAESIETKPSVESLDKLPGTHKVEIPILSAISPDSSTKPLPAHSVKVPIKLPPVKIPLPSMKNLLSSPPRPHLKVPQIRKEPILSEVPYKTERTEHVCPKTDCGKSFRKGNLLQMHIKHYHPLLFKKAKVCVPNVADLAYARTVGDHLDHHSPSHGSSVYQPTSEKWSKHELPARRASRHVSHDVKKLEPPPVKSSKDNKRKDIKQEVPEDEKYKTKEEFDEYINDLEEEPTKPVSVAEADPDYIPEEDEGKSKRREGRRERRRDRIPDSRIRKRKSLSFGNYSDEEVDTASSIRLRTNKRKSISQVKAPPVPVVDPPMPDPPAVDKKQAKEELVEAEEDGDTWAEVAEAAAMVDTSNEIINCGCGSNEEEGLMLLCDVCLCWQHGACYNINNEDEVPDKYICSLCDNPKLQRLSHKFRHHQEWLKEGKLPRFSFAEEANDARLESCVRRSHELTANVWQLSSVMHSLKLKLHMAKLVDHPKFVLWHKKWVESGEENEVPSESQQIPLMNDAQTSMDVVAALQQLINIGSTTTNQDITLSPGINKTSECSTSTNLATSVSQDLIMSQQVIGKTSEYPSTSHSIGTSDIADLIRPNECKELSSDITSTQDQVHTTSKEIVTDSQAAGDVSLQNQPNIDNTTALTSDTVPSPITKPLLDENLCSKIDDLSPSTSRDVVKDTTDIIPNPQSDDQNLPEKISDGKSSTLEELPQEEFKRDNSKVDNSVMTETTSILDTKLDSKLTDLSRDKDIDLKLLKDSKLDDSQIHEESQIIPPSKTDDQSGKFCADDVTEDQIDKTSQKEKLSEEKKDIQSSSETLKEILLPTDVSPESTSNAIQRSKESNIIDKSEPTLSSNISDSDKTSDAESQVNVNSSDPASKSQEDKEMDDSKKSLTDSTDLSNERELKTDGENTLAQVENTSNIDHSILTDFPTADELKYTLSECKDVDPGNSMLGNDNKQSLVALSSEISNSFLSQESTNSPVLSNLDEKKESDSKLLNPPMNQDEIKDDILNEDEMKDDILNEDEIKDDILNEDEMKEDILNEEDDMCVDVDLDLDFRGLTSSGDGGGSDLAALLSSSQDDLVQLMGQDNPELESLDGPPDPLQAPIIPEAERIEPVNCKLNLLDNVHKVQNQINARFDEIEKHLEGLEMEMGLAGEPFEELENDESFRDATTLQSRDLVKLIINDLTTVQKIAQFTP